MTDAWTKHATLALAAVHKALAGGINSILEVGFGDMAAVEAWDNFKETRYVGVESCPRCVGVAAVRHQRAEPTFRPNGRDFVLVSCTGLLGDDVLPPQSQMHDVVLALNMLHEVEKLRPELLAWIFKARRAVVLDYRQPDVGAYVVRNLDAWHTVYMVKNSGRTLAALVRRSPNWVEPDFTYFGGGYYDGT